MKRTLKELAEWVGGAVIGEGEVEISGVGSIEQAQPGEITFIANPKYLSKLGETRASAVIVSKDIRQANKPLLSSGNPYLAFAKILSLYCQTPYQARGMDSGAFVSPTAKVGKDVSIFPSVYIGDRCSIGDRVTLYPGVCIGEGTTIGEDSILHPNVSVYPRTIIGQRVILHAGVVIGSDGFGYAKDGKKNIKVPQIGTVEIEDDVEIGANTTVDRGTLGKTILRRGVKIDNLVQVAHNVVIGEDSIIVAQVGISGSTHLGSNVTVGGQAGFVGHITVGDNVMIGGQSGVMNDLASNQAYTGSPAVPHREFMRITASHLKLPEMKKLLSDIEKRLSKFERPDASENKEK